MTEAITINEVNETPPALANKKQQQKAYPVLDWFTCTNMMSQVFKCNLCDWQTSGPSSWRKLEHVLGLGNGSVKSCLKQSDLDVAARESLLVELESMNRRQASKKRNKDLETTATMSISCPKRQRRIKFATKDETDDMHMQYACMLIMRAVKSNFMDSSFTRNFIQVSRSPFRYIHNILFICSKHSTTRLLPVQLSWAPCSMPCTRTPKKKCSRSASLTMPTALSLYPWMDGRLLRANTSEIICG